MGVHVVRGDDPILRGDALDALVGELVGLVVDGLVGLREIVVHSVSDPLVAVPGIAGATELADGRISLIMDVAALIRRAREAGARARLADAPQPVAQLEGQS